MVIIDHHPPFTLTLATHPSPSLSPITLHSKVLLGKMDRNADQQIDRKELYAWILRSFK